ncbi:hypothetical protein FR932_03900 [Moritella marina ATCC 15381]|uniref:Response regulator n=1 Tax=Moritella marina ATCC 15381 TaxID=1202962 RepID=A0A5J6WIM0_MORMI|nr:hypothetical protein [Moritella marina]QFI37031.1 hypothetical protein FR932_03900 [Moritella marina ATCC 15381]
MLKKPIKVTTSIYSIFVTDDLNNFTVSEMRSAYMKITGETDPVLSRKMVYRQILRLQKLGMLEKVDSDNVKEHRYNKTTIFLQTGLTTEKLKSKPASKELTLNPKKVTSSLLDERLKQCEVDLIASIAESEEYMSLYKSMPELKEHLESNYLQSREHSSKLLGKIKAIKSVITYQKKQ